AQACALCAVALPCVRRSPRSTPFPYTTLFRSVAFGRAVPKEDILRAVALLFCGLSVLALGTTALLALEPERPLAAIFEAASAFSDRKSTRLNSSHVKISYAVFCLKKKKATRR